ncbi:hypothetical protein Scep_013887 [Stephania cephalantha]|uniref:Uncharacterized protein n=1 Tax=Stephania cephalantha TaxID=152367 RepID=A0AAP0J2R7_9MAGN
MLLVRQPHGRGEGIALPQALLATSSSCGVARRPPRLAGAKLSRSCKARRAAMEGGFGCHPLFSSSLTVEFPSEAPLIVAGGGGGGHKVVAAPISGVAAITPPSRCSSRLSHL